VEVAVVVAEAGARGARGSTFDVAATERVPVRAGSVGSVGLVSVTPEEEKLKKLIEKQVQARAGGRQLTKMYLPLALVYNRHGSMVHGIK
jgi:hypothetical protein